MQDQDQRIDVKENILATLDPKILNFLLKDKTINEICERLRRQVENNA